MSPLQAQGMPGKIEPRQLRTAFMLLIGGKRGRCGQVGLPPRRAPALAAPFAVGGGAAAPAALAALAVPHGLVARHPAIVPLSAAPAPLSAPVPLSTAPVSLSAAVVPLSAAPVSLPAVRGGLEVPCAACHIGGLLAARLDLALLHVEGHRVALLRRTTLAILNVYKDVDAVEVNEAVAFHGIERLHDALAASSAHDALHRSAASCDVCGLLASRLPIALLDVKSN
mmetsp:Transcript_31217/g.46563  ORF Transcript_31217/g.46563 Transcript_31217/m.46563 type:complete len:226 (+) Transcript_31217:274-951(+)